MNSTVKSESTKSRCDWGAKNMDEFSGQLFHFPLFFMVKWVLNQRIILSEWQCVVCKPESEQEHFIVAPMETTKQIIAWFTSTRENGNLVENGKSKIYNFGESWPRGGDTFDYRGF